LLALIPWVLVAMRFIDGGALPFFSSEEEIETDEDYEYTYDDEDEEEYPDYPEYEPDPNVGSEFTFAEETIVNISDEFPYLINELRTISSEYNSIAVSLVAFDGATSTFYTYQYGFADMENRQAVTEDTRFRVASLSKLVTAICAMVLVDEGLLDLDTDISMYLGYEVRNPHFPDTPITARMLLQHTSAVFDSGAFHVSRENYTNESLQSVLERDTSFRRRQPGVTFEYTNFGYSILAAVCEMIFGDSIDAMARELIFEPLGIDAAFVAENLRDTQNIAVIYNDRHAVTRSVQTQLAASESGEPGHDLHLAQSNLTISAIDYARILMMLGNGGILGDTRILSQESVSIMHRTDVSAPNYRQGLGLRFNDNEFLSNSGIFWHTGSSYGTFTQFAYVLGHNTNRGVVVLTTGATISRLPTGLINLCNDLSLAVWNGIWYPQQNANENTNEERHYYSGVSGDY